MDESAGHTTGQVVEYGEIWPWARVKTWCCRVSGSVMVVAFQRHTLKLGEVATTSAARPHHPTSNTASSPPHAMPFTALNNQVRVPQPPPVPAAVVNPTVVTPAGPHPEEIDKAFASNHELRKRVHAAIGMTLAPANTVYVT